MITRKSLFHFFSGLSFLLTGAIFLSHCSQPDKVLQQGYYRFAIDRPDGVQIVFNAEVKDSSGKMVLNLINAQDRLMADEISTKGDSILIQLPFFESGFMAKVDDSGNLSGEWIKGFGERVQKLPFKAKYGARERFPVTNPPVRDFSGRWSVTFTRNDGRTSPAVGEFSQNGSMITGTFLNPSGDYRFLEGVVSGDSLYLSGFDGGMALMVTATADSDHRIMDGKLYSGEKGFMSWTGRRDDQASLPDEYALTKLKPGATRLDFSFPDLNGDTVSIHDSRFKDKVVAVQIMGSWCPNCMDEARFVMENYDRYKEKGIEFIGLAYERTEDFATSRRDLEPFVRRFDIRYPILITGVTVGDPELTEKTLPQLDQIKAFPTTIFIDKRGEVRSIHAGFNGPATGKHYEIYKKDFEALVNALAEE